MKLFKNPKISARDRGIGNKAGGKSGPKVTPPYKFYRTPQPKWTANPDYFDRIKKRGYNDTENTDYDYYAHYDFEFAKSGSLNANFEEKVQAKLKKKMESDLAKQKAGKLGEKTTTEAYSGLSI